MGDLLERLARAESPSLEPEAQAGAFAILAGELGALGFAVRASAGGGDADRPLRAPADAPGGGPRQLMLGHMDTVWPVGTLRDMPVRAEAGRSAVPGSST